MLDGSHPERRDRLRRLRELYGFLVGELPATFSRDHQPLTAVWPVCPLMITGVWCALHECGADEARRDCRDTHPGPGFLA
ncbi:hypothetical protein [Phytoactinopolyspora endophytica]|uniref:hypothetical protein n=1 Tax=Phytoactinopolyspora endophytica TaxID=1642495 RepID=UPI003B83623E